MPGGEGEGYFFWRGGGGGPWYKRERKIVPSFGTGSLFFLDQGGRENVPFQRKGRMSLSLSPPWMIGCSVGLY